jgi:hypothetical protein
MMLWSFDPLKSSFVSYFEEKRVSGRGSKLRPKKHWLKSALVSMILKTALKSGRAVDYNP